MMLDQISQLNYHSQHKDGGKFNEEKLTSYGCDKTVTIKAK